ncbi:MAG: hypothetical protein PHX27_01205 [Candidatus ainarchaeum sp.]|nr:hypothetical protein [Candidatus ainarchaeum sp.]
MPLKKPKILNKSFLIKTSLKIPLQAKRGPPYPAKLKSKKKF